MKIISRYLYRTLSYYAALVLLFLLGMQFFIELTRELSNIGRGNYDLAKGLSYVLFMLPYDLYQFFPMIGLLGFIIALGLLATQGELMVLRASGLSLLNLFTILAKLGLSLVLLMLLVGEVIAPMALHKAEKLKMVALSEGKALLTKEGVWLHPKPNEVIHIEEINGKQIRGVTRYKLHAGRYLQEVTEAEKGYYDGKKWILQQIVGTRFFPRKLVAIGQARAVLEVPFTPHFLCATSSDSDQKNLVVLYRHIQAQRMGGLDASPYLFSFWHRLFNPLAALVMMLLAIPFVFGSLRSATIGFKMLIGIAVGFTFYMVNQVVGPVAVVYQVPPWLAALLPSLLFSLFGIIMLARVR